MANPNNKKVAVTAGLRGASWSAQRMLEPYRSTPYPLLTEDGQGALGMLFSGVASARYCSSCILANWC